MDLHLTERIAVVTGASSGIGLAVTKALVDEGARVITGSRSVSVELETLTQGGRVTAHRVDLATPGGPGELIARAEALGGLDILVNNVGAVTPRTDGFLAIDDEAWLQTFTLSFFAALRATRAAIPLMLKRGGGNVVTIGSVNAFLPDPGVVDYSAAKAALWNTSKSLSKEFGPRGIRFNTISPGPVATPLWLGDHGVASTISGAGTGATDDERAAARAAVISRQEAAFSTGRFTEPQEVADLVLLLASDRAGNVTGADYLIDGGLIQTL